MKIVRIDLDEGMRNEFVLCVGMAQQRCGSEVLPSYGVPRVFG